MHFEGTIKDIGGNRMTIEPSLGNEGILQLTEWMREDNRLVFDVDLFRAKRSLNANAYFWQLCDKMAKKLGADKDIIYLMMLSRYGVFQDVEVVSEAVETLQQMFRYCEEVYSYKAEREAQDGETEAKTIKCIRCYIGSSHYDTKEMSDLINGTVNDAQELGIDTWTPEEIEQAINLWKGSR